MRTILKTREMEKTGVMRSKNPAIRRATPTMTALARTPHSTPRRTHRATVHAMRVPMLLATRVPS
jgi:hypothetical protein